MKREHLAWGLIGLFNLVAVVILAIGLAPAVGYAIVFTWRIILGIAIASLVIAVALLVMIVRQR